MVTLSGAAILLAALTACADKTGGVPTATTGGDRPTSPPSRESPTSGPSSTSKAGNSPLSATDPCDLLPSSALGPLGVTGTARSGERSRGRFCRWDVEKDSVADSLTFSVVVYDTLGTGDIVAKGTPEPIADIGTHQALRYTGVADNCVIAFPVTEASRVDVQVTGSTLEKSCAFAPEVARSVEPELP